MKAIIKDELRARLTCAAANGSVVAKDILAQLKLNADVSTIIRGNANYFATKRKRQSGGEYYSRIKIVFTYCNKDLNNDHFPDKNNPQAPWYNENRTEAEPATFIKCFKNLPDYSDVEMEYFANSICVMSKVSVKLYEKMSDFEDAYSQENYAPSAQFGDSTLHNSCMRHEMTSRNAADFYYNFAGAKIIIAKDAEDNILGRAVVWKNTTHSKDEQTCTLSVIDRVYYTHSFVMKMILQYAEEIGINLKKTYNDYSHPEDFIVLNPIDGVSSTKDQSLSRIHLRIQVPASKWHKEGVPYMDTFSNILVTDDGLLELSNRSSNRDIARCQSTNGYASKVCYYCPKCGRLSNNDDVLCKSCRSELIRETAVGSVIIDKVVSYQDKEYPASLFAKGKPIPTLALYLQIQKLYS